MKIKNFLFIILSGIVLSCSILPVNVWAAESDDGLGLPDFPQIVSDYVVLMDADSGEVLYSSNKDEKCYPASTTKLLTALLVMENCALSDTVTYSQAAVNSIEFGDANASIVAGEELSVEQSLYCLLLRSANEVAYGLAEYVGKTESAFASMMNDKATELGAVNTHFTNASGLTDAFHYTTPYDMALIAKACFNNKSLMRIVSYSELYTIGPTNKSNFTRYYRHRYQMLAGGEYAYKYSCGGKTGYTDAAGSCLVSFAQKDDLRLICVIMKSSEEDRYLDTINLFDYYFNNFKKVPLADFDTGLDSGSIDILELTNRFDSSTGISIGFSEDAYILIPKSVDASKLTGIVTYADNAAYTGEEGGFACISYYYENTRLGSATIFINRSSTEGVIPGTNGVSKLGADSIYQEEDIFFLNIWYIVGGVLVICVITSAVIFVTKSKARRHGRYGSKKLRF